ncbi:type IV secretion protein Rhs [Streptomyces griseocarneus]|nr:type IV secretion protein Rhs [Streptomyces griseocarneus]
MGRTRPRPRRQPVRPARGPRRGLLPRGRHLHLQHLQGDDQRPDGQSAPHRGAGRAAVLGPDALGQPVQPGRPRRLQRQVLRTGGPPHRGDRQAHRGGPQEVSIFDKAGEKFEHALDKGKKLAGEAVEWGGHKASETLDDLGFHGAADNVEHWSDKQASELGAKVGEKQLDDTDDPEELLHGDAKAIERTAGHLKSFGKAFNTAHSGMQKVDPSQWKGEGKEAFARKFAEHAPQWAHAADSCEDAATALSTYAHTVTWAQGQAKEAVRLHKKGKKAAKDAQDAYKKAADAYNAKIKAGEDPGAPPPPCTDPGIADREEAERILKEARKQRNTAASTAQKAIEKAVELAPKLPKFSDRVKGDSLDLFDGGQVEAMHLLGGGVRSVTDAARFARTLNPLDPYNLTHPAAYLDGVAQTSMGLASTAAHPGRIPGMLLGDGWGSDPSEASGRLAGNFLMAIATGGGSAAAQSGERMAIGAARRGAADAAESGAARELSAARRELAGADGPRGPARGEGAKATENTDPVDLATGRMFLPQTDVVLAGVLPLVFHRKVQSGYRAGRWLGPSWSSTADQRLETDAEGVVLVGEDGMLLSYPHPVPGVPTLPVEGPRRPLSRAADGTYELSDPLSGRAWHYTPYDDSVALLTSVRDREGRALTFVYAPDGTPAFVGDEAGRSIRFTTEAGRITALHLVAGDVETELVRYGYTDGDLTEVVNSSGLPMRFGYDEHGRVTSWTDRNNRHYDYVYDERGRCVFESGTEGHMRAAIEYGDPDPATGLRVTTVTDAVGHVTRHVFNAGLQAVARISPDGAVTRTQWDRYDRPLSRTDALGHTTEFRHDEDGRLLSVIRPDGRSTTAAYGVTGGTETVTHADGTVWRQTYDEAGRRTSVTDPSGTTTRFGYDEHGHPASVTDALGNVTRVTCDATGLPVEITDPLGGTTAYRRDPFGRVTTVIDPLGATTHLSWTVEGKLARRVGPDGAEERWTYDGEGNCVTHVDPLGGVTTSEYTHFDLLSARTGPDGVRYEFTHDALLRLVQVTNPQGLSWDYAYDEAGRLTTETDFDGRTLTYAHDAVGRLAARTNGLGQTVAYERDALGKVIRKDADGAVTTYAYDAAGRLVEAAGPDGTLLYGRDRLGRVKSETYDGRTLTFTYDELGRRRRRVTPSGAVSSWTYDAAGRRTSLTASGHTFAMEYDAAGREVARHFGVGLTLTQAWEPTGRLSSQTLTGPDEGVVQSRAYTYRRDGAVTSAGDRTFDLDATGRVTAVDAAGWSERYAYDAAGNQTQAEWPQDHPGTDAAGSRVYAGTRLTRAGRVHYEHDAQGRVVLRRVTRLSRKPDVWRYEWDAEDRVTAVTTPDGTRWRYAYDPLGRRVAKERLDATGEVTERVAFTWSGFTLVEQTTESASLPNPVTLTWDHDGLHPVAQTERILTSSQEEVDSRFFAIVTDLIGTPTELVDEHGDIAWQARSTLWGTTAWPRGSTTYTPLRFPGQYFDPESGLHYNVHRHYDPSTARYMSADPLGLAPAPNPVAYVHNPVTWADPLGLAPYGGSSQGADSPAGPGPWDMTGRDPMSVVPDHAGIRELTPDPNGGAQYGLEYKWMDSQERTVRLRIHGPDGNAPAGSNAAMGDSYRIQFGGKYQDDLGNLYPRNVHNENSPHYNPDAANATHIPWPEGYPGL